MRSHRWLVVDTVSIETFLFSALSLQLGYPKVLGNNCSVNEYPQKQRAEFLNASSQLQVDTPDGNFQDCIIGEQCLLGFKCFDRWSSTVRYLMECDAKMVLLRSVDEHNSLSHGTRCKDGVAKTAQDIVVMRVF